MKSIVIVLLFVVGVCLPKLVFAQCNNSVKVKEAKSEVSQNSGSIEISISTTKQFTCTLNIEKGSGPEKVETKKGIGNQSIEFRNLDKSLGYQVVVEFIGEENKLCKTLQKSQIILE